MNLSGTFSATHFGQLTALTALNLGGNDLRGSFPPSLNQTIRYVDLSNNSFVAQTLSFPNATVCLLDGNCIEKCPINCNCTAKDSSLCKEPLPAKEQEQMSSSLPPSTLSTTTLATAAASSAATSATILAPMTGSAILMQLEATGDTPEKENVVAIAGGVGGGVGLICLMLAGVLLAIRCKSTKTDLSSTPPRPGDEMLSARDDVYAAMPDLGTMPYVTMPVLSQHDSNTSAGSTPYAAMPAGSSSSTTDYGPGSVTSYGTEFSPIDATANAKHQEQ
jgi:hypothetical protein